MANILFDGWEKENLGLIAFQCAFLVLNVIWWTVAVKLVERRRLKKQAAEQAAIQQGTMQSVMSAV